MKKLKAVIFAAAILCSIVLTSVTSVAFEPGNTKPMEEHWQDWAEANEFETEQAQGQEEISGVALTFGIGIAIVLIGIVFWLLKREHIHKV